MVIQRKGNVIAVATENLGIAIHGEYVIPDDVTHVYAALTGDRCAITNIRIHHDR